MADWTDELKEQVIQEYEKADPTPENSMDIVQELAEKYEKTVNGIRMILSKAGVYVKKAPASKSTSVKDKDKPASTRISKESAIKSLNDAIEALGMEPEAEIIDKLTGKAALYFATLINSVRRDA